MKSNYRSIFPAKIKGGLTAPQKKEKKFDAVRFMREQRIRISRETAGMTFEQEKAYYEKHAKWWTERKERQAVSGSTSGK